MLPFLDRLKYIRYNKVMGINFEQRKRAWARVQRQLGFYAPKNVRRSIEEELERTEDMEDYEGSVGDFLRIGKLFAASSYLPKPKTPQNPPKKRYQRPFQKRLHLVYFVIGKQLSSKKQQNKIRKRINWGDTCKAWNETHPNDQMTPKVLKSTFYRAVADEDLQQEFKKEMGGFIIEALWVARLYGLLESKDLVMAWANLLSTREMFHKATGVPLDNRQEELEHEMIANPYAVRELGREMAILVLAEGRGLDPAELKDLSNEELREIVKSGKYKQEAKDEGKHSTKRQA